MFVWGIILLLLTAVVVAVRGLRLFLSSAYYYLCGLLLCAIMLLLWLVTRVPRWLYGACPDPTCDGSLDPPVIISTDEQGVATRSTCSSCGSSVEEYVPFAVEELVRMQFQTFP